MSRDVADTMVGAGEKLKAGSAGQLCLRSLNEMQRESTETCKHHNKDPTIAPGKNVVSGMGRIY